MPGTPVAYYGDRDGVRTSLLNEYFTKMSTIAFAHGGTVDKFVGDAIIVFFGDPQTRGTAEDTKACVRMAVAMQARLAELSVMWHSRGIAAPFRVRVAINTGFCDVGNFGSGQRMDYTIIGAAMNLAARLQAIAEPGEIVVGTQRTPPPRAQHRARGARAAQKRPRRTDSAVERLASAPICFAAGVNAMYVRFFSAIKPKVTADRKTDLTVNS